jgi:hypothetical protein
MVAWLHGCRPVQDFLAGKRQTVTLFVEAICKAGWQLNSQAAKAAVLSGMFFLCDAPATGLRGLMWAASSIMSMSPGGWASSDISDTGLQPQTPRDAAILPISAALSTPVKRLVGLAIGHGDDAGNMPAAFLFVPDLVR